MGSLGTEVVSRAGTAPFVSVRGLPRGAADIEASLPFLRSAAVPSRAKNRGGLMRPMWLPSEARSGFSLSSGRRWKVLSWDLLQGGHRHARALSRRLYRTWRPRPRKRRRFLRALGNGLGSEAGPIEACLCLSIHHLERRRCEGVTRPAIEGQLQRQDELSSIDWKAPRGSP